MQGLDLDADALLYQCAGLVATEALSGTSSPADPDPAAANAFNLASRPAATKKIWLDFLGGVVSGTAWNSASMPRCGGGACNGPCCPMHCSC